MNSNIEDILDQALTALRRGQSPAEVLSMFPEHAAELKPLLEVASMGLYIPRNIVPTPLRRHSFAERHYRSWWLNTANLLKFGVMPLTLVFILLGAKTVVSKTERSRPAEAFYTLKLASEQLRLTFTRGINQQAAFQVQLTQRRLDEVKQAENPAEEAAALAELKDQSQKTFAQVPQVAAAVAIASKDTSLLNSLVAINKQQQEVLTAIQPQGESKGLADTALQTAKENGHTLAAIVATVQEQTLADLPNKISLTGDAIVSADKSKITIAGTIFAITKDTVITSPDGAQTNASQLPAKAKATIVGTKTEAGIVAKVVSLTSTIEQQPEQVPTPTESKKTPPVNAPSAAQPATAPAAGPDQNQVTAGVIVEPAPSPSQL